MTAAKTLHGMGKLTLSELEVALLTASLTLSMVTNDDAGSGV